MSDSIVRRKWGERAREAAIRALDERRKLLVVNAFCGSGKTLTFMDICNELYRRGIIEKVLVLSPRVNLCHQYETSWKGFRRHYSGTVLGQVCHRFNDPPLLRDCMFDGPQDGVAVTYASLGSNFDLYKDFCREHRVAVVADEAQILGSSLEEEEGGTRAAELVQRLYDLSRFTILGTGTPTRSDGLGLLLCGDRYGPPDANGIRLLLADVEATYLEGVAEGYLRPFEARLVDGKALREYIDNFDRETIFLSKMTSGMTQIITQPSFWQPMVDIAVEEYRPFRKIDPRYALLIGACSQKHADAIAGYCHRRHGDIGTLLAISADPTAQDMLKTFKKGRHGIMVSVGMVYVGYDHSWISVVLCLNAFRHHGWLDQFAMRGGRMVLDEPNVPPSDQTLLVVGPDDKPFRKWADARRKDAQQGLRMRDERGRTAPPIQERMSYILEAEATHSTAVSMDPKNDVNDPARFRELQRIRQEFNLGPINLTGLDALLRSQGMNVTPSPEPTPPEPCSQSRDPDITDEDRVKALRSKLGELTKKIDGMLKARGAKIEWGWTYNEINKHFSCNIGDQGHSSVFLAKVIDWTNGTLKPQASQWKAPESA